LSAVPKTHFGNWIFPSSGKMKDTPTLLERANLNHNPVTEVSGSLMLILA
jgi:hypothetical protein